MSWDDLSAALVETLSALEDRTYLVVSWRVDDRVYVQFAQSRRHRWWPYVGGAPGKTPFPSDWSGARILHEASDVATDPASSVILRGGGREVLTGTRGGVDIRVVVDYSNNNIITAYPTNLPRNP